MQKLQVIRVTSLKLCPNLPHSKVALTDIGVMKHYNSTRSKFGQPGFKIMEHGLIRVQPVNVQHLYGFICKICDGIIKSHPQQPRKSSVVFLMMRTYFGVNFIAIFPCMLIPLPRINGIAFCRKIAFSSCLAKREIGISTMRAKLDKYLW